jgi:hypothetical protein
MTVARFVYPAVFFVSGLGVGVLWSPIERPHTPDRRALADEQAEIEKLVAQAREAYGEEVAEFVRQCEDMTTRTKGYPINAWASPDGRFVVSLFENHEIIASELRNLSIGPPKELVRQYSFSCNGRSWSCDFGRTIEDSKMTNVYFSFTDAKGGSLSYVDDDADGRWDRLIDETGERPAYYHRDGLCWKERAIDAAKESDAAGAASVSSGR